MALQHDALEHRVFARASVLISGAPAIPLSSALKSVLNLLPVVFVLWLRKYLIASPYVMQGAKLSVN
jgi:hypothetical protein